LKKSRFNDNQIVAILTQGEADTPAPELCRTHGVSFVTISQMACQVWGMDASMLSRVKELELENARLRKMCAEAQMSADILKEAMAPLATCCWSVSDKHKQTEQMDHMRKNMPAAPAKK
jgi:putative transposase